jgi:hypothetical protein
MVEEKTPESSHIACSICEEPFRAPHRIIPMVIHNIIMVVS